MRRLSSSFMGGETFSSLHSQRVPPHLFILSGDDALEDFSGDDDPENLEPQGVPPPPPPPRTHPCILSGDVALKNPESQGVFLISFLVQRFSSQPALACPACSGPGSPTTSPKKHFAGPGLRTYTRKP